MDDHGDGTGTGIDVDARIGKGPIEGCEMETESARVDGGVLRERDGLDARALTNSLLPTHRSVRNALRIP